jgi:hypothetical protein
MIVISISAGGNRKRNSRRSPGSHTLLSTAPANRLPGKNTVMMTVLIVVFYSIFLLVLGIEKGR